MKPRPKSQQKPQPKAKSQVKPKPKAKSQVDMQIGDKNTHPKEKTIHKHIPSKKNAARSQKPKEPEAEGARSQKANQQKMQWKRTCQKIYISGVYVGLLSGPCLPIFFHGYSLCSAVLFEVNIFAHVYRAYMKVKYDVRI